MFDVSLYKYDKSSESFIRDPKTSKSSAKLCDAEFLLQEMVTIGTQGYNGCAIYDTNEKIFLKYSYVDPSFKKIFKY